MTNSDTTAKDSGCDWHRPRLIAGLAALLALALMPFVMMLVMSLKSNAQIFAHFWELPAPPRWDFYGKAWDALSGYIFNTLLVAVLTVAGVLTLSSMAGYTFARHRFPGREALYYLILALMMIPGVLTLIPTFALVKAIAAAGVHLGGWTFGPFALLNTRWALILPYISGGQILGILLCRGFFQGLPEEMFEAARLDGAGEFAIYRRHRAAALASPSLPPSPSPRRSASTTTISGRSSPSPTTACRPSRSA